MILIVETVARMLVWGATAAVLCTVTIGSVDVLSTLILGRPFAGVYEMTQLFLVLVIFLPQAGICHTQSHVSVDLFDRDNRILRPIRRLTTYLGGLLCYCLLAWTSWVGFMESVHLAEYSEGLLRWPVWPFRLGLFLGTLAALVVILLSPFRKTMTQPDAEELPL